MRIHILSNADQVANYGASMCKQVLKNKEKPVLGLATGSTPIALYKELVKFYKKKEISFKRVTSFNLDEYVGLDDNHPQTFRSFMNEHLFKHVDIHKDRTFFPYGKGQDPLTVGQEYEELIEDNGGIDFQILGLGSNGHIGFNEPTSSLNSKTRIKTLTQQTVKDNSRFFKPDEFQPSVAITMGIATISNAREIVLLATGKHKAQAVAKMVEGPISAICPASILQFHQKTTILLDEDAAKDLILKEYYYWVQSVETTYGQYNSD